MFDQKAVRILRDSLLQRGSAILNDAQGKRLALISNKILGIETACVLISYEGHGSFYYEFDRPLNAFRLVSAGFPITVAEEVATLINHLFSYLRKEVIETDIAEDKSRKT